MKQKEIKKVEIKDVAREYTLDEAKRMLIRGLSVEGDYQADLRQFRDEILPKFFQNDVEAQKEALEKYKDKTLGLLVALETDTHVGLMETFNSQYRGLAKELTKEVIKDYSCSTSLEKVLAESVVNAYIRILDTSRRFNNSAEVGEYITDNRTKYLAMLSKQIDRANRQFLSALMTLKQIKAPTIEMNIKTTNTFVAQNQQINAEKLSQTNGNENNEAK